MKYYEILRLRIILVFLNSFQENPKKKKMPSLFPPFKHVLCLNSTLLPFWQGV